MAWLWRDTSQQIFPTYFLKMIKYGKGSIRYNRKHQVTALPGQMSWVLKTRYTTAYSSHSCSPAIVKRIWRQAFLEKVSFYNSVNTTFKKKKITKLLQIRLGPRQSIPKYRRQDTEAAFTTHAVCAGLRWTPVTAALWFLRASGTFRSRLQDVVISVGTKRTAMHGVSRAQMPTAI